jgi:hypothetical protein
VSRRNASFWSRQWGPPLIGINDAGQIVGIYGDDGGTSHGYLLSEGIYTTIDVPGSTFTRANGINASGQIMGAYQAGGTSFHGYLATPEITAPSVTCSVADSLLWPPNHRLVNVGLDVTALPPDATVQVQVYADDHATASDARDIGPDTLRLRAERSGQGLGRVYLIVVTATNPAGSAFDVCSVVVPHSNNPLALALVRTEAFLAEGWYRLSHTAPPGFRLLGEGPDGGGGGEGGAASPSSGGSGSAIAGDVIRVTSTLAAPTPPATSATPVATAPADKGLPGREAAPVDGLFAAAPREGSFLTWPRLRYEHPSEGEQWVPGLLLDDDRLSV